MLLALLLACGDETELSSEEGYVLSSEIMVDSFGRHWIPTRKITAFSDEGWRPKDDDDGEDVDISKLPLDELTQMISPLREFNGIEYTLSYEDSYDIAYLMQQEARDPDKISGAPGFDPTDIDAHQQRPFMGNELSDTTATSSATTPRRLKVFGTDDRQNYNHNAATYPYNNHGAMTYYSGNIGDCSSFKLINNHAIVTAAHCIHTGAQWKPRHDIQFQAGSSSPLTAVPAACYSRTVPSCWDGSNVSCDYAVISLRGGGEWCPLSTYNVGYLGWNSVPNRTSGVAGFVSGYPGSPPKGWSYPTLVYHWRDDAWTSLTYPARLWYMNDTTNGQSGTPFISYYEGGSWRARAIHRGGHTGVFSDSNQGRRLDSSLITWLTSFGGS